MKKLLFIFPLFAFTYPTADIEIVPIKLEQIHITVVELDIPSLANAIIFVESSNNDSAYCKVEDAVGCMQIRRTMVRDINRILKTQRKQHRYKYKDRWNRLKSIEMFNIYIEHYGLDTSEEIARAWNGGPRGYKKSATIKYWNKVKKWL